MSIFNRKKEDIVLSNGVDINNVNDQSIGRPFLFKFGKGHKDFTDIVLYTIFTKIFNGLKNVTWKTTELDYMAEDIITFINNNMELLIYNQWYYGYICVMVNKDGTIRLPYANEVKKDGNGRVTNNNAITIYSQPYQIEKRSHIMLIQPLLQSMNINFNSSDFVNSNLGLFGIISSKGVPMSPAGKEEFQAKLKKNYGMSADQFQFILSNAEVNYQPITIPVDALKLNENIDFQIKTLCKFFNLNPMLFYGDSTFNNQEAATRAFYDDCVKPLAEVLLLLARNIYIRLSKAVRPSTIITYNLSNIPQYNKTLSETCAERSAYLDYLLKLKDAGVDVSNELNKLANETKTMLEEI